MGKVKNKRQKQSETDRPDTLTDSDSRRQKCPTAREFMGEYHVPICSNVVPVSIVPLVCKCAQNEQTTFVPKTDSEPSSGREAGPKESITIKAEEFVDDKLSKKILEQARIQQEELEEEHGVRRTKSKQQKTVSLGAASSSKKPRGAGSDSEEDLSSDEEGGEFYEVIDVNEEDEEALQKFMSSNPTGRRTLADIIQEKITEKQTEIQSQMSDAASVQMQQLDDRVVNMYKSIKEILQRYRSGKLPKAFKIVPNLQNWEQILYLTEPDTWSAAAMYQATRIFASNLNAKMAQSIFQRNFITIAGDCTLREAVIISSILAKMSIPMLHSAAAILKIAEMDYNGANSIFLRTLLDKKYALPYRVVDSVVFHFVRFTTDKRELPVLWHQCLLTFMQRYKEDISSEQKKHLWNFYVFMCMIKLRQKFEERSCTLNVETLRMNFNSTAARLGNISIYARWSQMIQFKCPDILDLILLYLCNDLLTLGDTHVKIAKFKFHHNEYFF
ncbi:hypothetical protein KUTeg_000805 [Tegillarca granosa]|uniref:Bystin n=1 Tax=Tegillarca granosa TaxID=220873 RepID=A0ABQ9FYQ9_TEGGR|nr:hypothetical protein KUTeg_000805 [Tegillarca granosa]